MNYYFEKLQQAIRRRGNTFVFIDAANLERSAQDLWVNPKDVPDNFKNHTAEELCWKIDYRKMRDFFKKVCDLKRITFYSARFDTNNHNKFLSFLKKGLKFKLETKSLKEYEDYTLEKPHRKANFDVEIAVDATYFLSEYKIFILFSGDCDFEYLLKFLRGQNKTTVVFSRTGHIAKELPPASSYYFDIVDFRQEFLRVDLKKQPAKNPA